MSELPPLDTRDGESAGEAPDMAAAELALGLLDGEERAAALRRVLAEPGFARAVERWRGQLAQLFDLWPAMAAPDVLARVERSIDRPAASGVPAPRAPGRFWPGLAALSSIAAAVLLVMLFIRPVALPPAPSPRPAPTPAPAPAAPTLVASIAPAAAGGSSATAVYDAQAGTIRLTEASFADARRSAQMWVIPGDGTPHSLGLLQRRGGTALTLDPANRARIAAGATLAISLEPIGGSPTGLPTGPVVATGKLSRV